MGNTIKIGDYIQGCEYWGITLEDEETKYHITRIVVKEISFDKDGKGVYYGKADDEYHGARGGTVRESLGEIKIITDVEPFTTNWWEEYTAHKVWKRDWVAFDLVRDFEGNLYRIVGTALNANTGAELILFKQANGKGRVYAKTKREFERRILSRESYPKAIQDWSYMKVDESGNEIDNSSKEDTEPTT